MKSFDIFPANEIILFSNATTTTKTQSNKIRNYVVIKTNQFK